MSHIWTCHVTRRNEPCRTYEGAMSRIRISHVTRIDETCDTADRFMSYMHVKHIKKPHLGDVSTLMCRPTHEWVMAHISLSHDTRRNESRYTRISHITHMNQSYHTYRSVMGHIWKRHVINACETRQEPTTWRCQHTRVSFNPWMSHDTHMNESCHTYTCVKSYVWMSHVSYQKALTTWH